MKRFLVTSPHSFCDDTIIYRHCDKSATDAGKHIVSALSAYNVVYHPNTSRLRSDCDYNRPESNNAKWRDELRRHARDLKPDFAIEVHSFPGDHKLYKQLWPNANLVIFESKYNKKFLKRLINAIRHRYPSINMHVAQPWHDVSITEDMGNHADVKKHTLFEFNEDMSEEECKKIADAVAFAVVDVVSDKYDRKRAIITAFILATIIVIIIVLGAASFRFLSHSLVYTCRPEGALRMPHRPGLLSIWTALNPLPEYSIHQYS